MGIITISRQIGSLGDEIAKAVADDLGYEYIEKNKISEALSHQGISKSDIDIYDEKKPSIWHSLSIQKNKFFHLIRVTVYELAAKDNVVIVGRGGQVILKDFSGALHVRIIAPYVTRIRRLVEQKGYDEKNAKRIIRQSDSDSSGYLSTYFEADWDDGNLYDLVINTRTITLEKGVAMINCAASANGFKKSPQAFEKLNDLALTHKVEAVLLEIPGLEVTNLSVEKGVVDLLGLAKSSATKEECEKAISNIKGVTKINNQLRAETKISGRFYK